MNNIYSFDDNKVKPFLKSVKKHLTENGLFIFSSHKLPDNNIAEKMIKERISRELLLEKGQSTIALEVF